MNPAVPPHIAAAAATMLAPYAPGLTASEIVARLCSAPTLSAPEQTRFLTIAEAAKRLRITRQTLHALRKSGKLDSVKLGRRVLVPESVISRLLPDDR